MRRLALFGALLARAQSSATRVVEEVTDLSVTAANIRGQSVTHPIKPTIFRDDEAPRAPFLVLNHGRPAKAEDFVKMGRQRFSDNAKYFVARGFVVLVPTRRTLPYVDTARGIVLGQSFGGATALAVSAKNLPGARKSAFEDLLSKIDF